jgi:uncharacterized protein (DUF736 family)
MNIGTFKKSGKNLEGSISTFGAQFPAVTFEAITKTGNGPDYRITTPEGGELGAAWQKTSGDGNTNYLSVTFKGPLLPKPINAALFETKKAGTHNLVWDEPKKQQEA